MQQITGTELARLTPDELRKIHGTLVRRYRDFDGGNILGIAFGAKRRNRRAAENPIVSVRFLVRRKRCPRSKNCRLPEEARVRFLRKNPRRFVEAIFPTDVEVLGRIHSTGVRIVAPSDAATAGLVFKVRIPGLTGSGPNAFTWAVLTVGHIFKNENGDISVTVGGLGTGSQSVPATVVPRTVPPAQFDVAVAEAEFGDLQKGNLVVPDGSSLFMRSESDLTNDAKVHTAGIIMRRRDHGGDATFTVLDYSPELPVGPLGKLKCVIRAQARQNGVFRNGTSGAIWRIGDDGELSGMQVATETGDRIGYAQALFVTLNDWVRSEYDAFPSIIKAF